MLMLSMLGAGCSDPHARRYETRRRDGVSCTAMLGARSTAFFVQEVVAMGAVGHRARVFFQGLESDQRCVESVARSLCAATVRNSLGGLCAISGKERLGY